MKIKEIVEILGMCVKAGKGGLENEVKGGYASDLLSDVIAHAKTGDIWITLQTHQNIVAVASMKELAGIILVNARQPEEDTLKKAEQENVPILVSGLPAFEVAGRLYALFSRSMGK
jgi:predicted transcriptional regulator